MPPGPQRPKPLTERRGERPVERLNQLRPGAEVDVEGRPRTDRRQTVPSPLGPLDVRLPEAVDGLLSVAGGKRIPRRDRLDQLELDDVRVLQLIHHDMREPSAVALPDVGLASQQLSCPQLEVVEV